MVFSGSANLPSASSFACRRDASEVISHLKTDGERGLDWESVTSLQAVHGYNEFEVKVEDSLIMKFLDQFKQPLIIMLLCSAAVSLFMGQYDDAISITLAITIVSTVAFVQEYRSEKSLQQLNKLVPNHCHVLREGRMIDLLARELVPGDVVVISVGDRVPADIRLLEAVNLEVDESSLTGETQAAIKHTKIDGDSRIAEEIEIAERHNICFLGTLVRSGRGKGVVVGTGEKSEFGSLFLLMRSVDNKRTPLQLKMDELGQKLSCFSFGIIGFIMIIGAIQKKNLLGLFTIGVSLAVAAIPEGLPIVVTVTLALGVIRMAKRKAIVKKLPSVESLGCASVICSDKTGTLTQNEMTITHIYTPFDESFVDVTGSGYSVEGMLHLHNNPIDVVSHPHVAKLLEVGNLCNNSHLHDNQLIGQPTEGALLVCAAKMGIYDLRQLHDRTYEIPFSSEQKWMAVRCRKRSNDSYSKSSPPSSGEVYYLKGILEVVLERCTTFYYGENNFRPAASENKEAVFIMARQLATKGLRIIGLAFGDTLETLTFVGFVGIIDPPRPGVISAVRRLHNSSVIVVMITGDSKDTAISIGEHLGIYDASKHFALSGSDLDTMDQSALSGLIPNTRVFYRTSPKHKMSIIHAFQNDNHVVAMTGDGVNDAPALKLADVGVAMGKSGTDVSKEAADMILVDDDFSTIMAAIEEGKCIYYNIKNFLRFQLSTSIAALSLITISTLCGLPNPLNAMQILWINIIMDGPPAQSLGVEPVDCDIMSRPPRHSSDPIITKQLVIRILTSAVIIVAGTLLVFVREMTADNVVTARDTTMTFTTFVMFDMFNALSCRSEDKSISELGLFSNTAFIWAIGGSIIGQLLVIYSPFLQTIFQTEPLSCNDLLFICMLSSSVTIVDEIRKFYNKRYVEQPKSCISSSLI